MQIRNICLVQHGMTIPNVTVTFDECIHSVEKNASHLSESRWEGCYLVPGFVDTHIHGAAGFDTCDGTIDAIRAIETFLYSKGVTRFLPTTLSIPFDEMIKVLNTVREYRSNSAHTTVAGVHLEGPYLSVEQKGAHVPEHIRPISATEFEGLMAYQDLIRVVTMAPEISANEEMIARFRKNGIMVSIGHTNATYDQCLRAIGHGANRFTHLFNAMAKMHHREPGTTGAGLLSDAFVELVCDRLHVSDPMIQLVYRSKSHDQIVLITDSMRATGLADGAYKLGELKVHVDKSGARLEDGTLAGSTLTMDQALKNTMDITGMSLQNLIGGLTCNPAKSAGLEPGWIDVDQPADMVILSSDYRVMATIKSGKTVYGEMRS